MKRRNKSEKFLPITFGLCLIATVGAYLALNKKPKVIHHQYQVPKVEAPKVVPKSENISKAEPITEDLLLDFKADILTSKSIKENKDIKSKKGENSLSLSYRQNFFRRSSYELYKSAKKQLHALAPYLKKHGNVLVKVYGHTDKAPIYKRNYRKWNTNRKLSELRSKTIKQYLIKQGVNPYHISIDQKTNKQKTINNRGITLIFESVPTSSTLAGVLE